MAEKELKLNDDLHFLIGLTGLAAKWEEVGIHLGVPVDQLETIDLNNSGRRDKVESCLRDMFIWWLRNGKEKTVGKLVKAVHAADRHGVEREIKQKYGIPCVPEVQEGHSVTEFNLPVKVQRYCDGMKARYLQQSILPESDWPPSLGRQYIRLALIQQGRLLAHHRYEDVIEQQKDYTLGDYDKILEYKTRIKLEAAFRPDICEGGNEINPLKMLIDGAPGVGKTTLSRKVSRMWAKGELVSLKQYWLVLLLHLRESPISKAKTIDDFFYREDSELQREVIKFVKERGGDGVLIIFDGFDELNLYERSEESLFLHVCKGQILPKCAVVVTSRPYASRSLQVLHSISRHIEVLGFTDEQVELCIKKTVKDEVKAKELCMELKDRLDIASICQIPLNCSIVLYVYEQEKYSLPRTLTELYNLFVLHSLKRFIKRTQNTTAANRLLYLNKLTNPSSRHYKSLCSLALKGLEEDKLVFSSVDIEEAFPEEYQESDNLPLLDLMTSAKSYSSRGAQDTYSFLHLTIQEFLAAYWVAHYSSDTKKLELYQKNLLDNRFRMVLLFLSGMTKLAFPQALDVFSQISWDNDIIHACHLLYESGNHRLFKSISHKYISSKVIELTGSAFDTLVTAHFLAYGGSQLDTLKMRSKDVRIVHREFSTCTAEKPSIRNISVTLSPSSHDLMLLRYFEDLSTQIDMVTVTVEVVCTPSHEPSLKEQLKEVLLGRNAISKKKYAIALDPILGFRDSYFIKQSCKTLIECVTQNSSVIGVTLKSISAEEMSEIFTCLSQGNNLVYLTCRKGYRRSPNWEKQPPICRKFCTSLVSFLSRNTSLVEVDLSVPLHRNVISDYIKTIKSGLISNTVLQKLSLIGMGGGFVFERNQLTKEMELIKGEVSDSDETFQSTDCDLSPPQAKRPCQGDQGHDTFSVPCSSDSPSYGDSRVHPSPLFQSQPPSSTFSSASSLPIKGCHSRSAVGVSLLPQDIHSPDVIDLTHDSSSPQSPHDHDHTYSSTYSTLPPTTAVTPLLWSSPSPLVKHEKLSGHVEVGRSPTRSFFSDQKAARHSQFQQTSYPHGQLTNASMMQESPASPLMGCLNMYQQQRSSSSFMMTYPTGHPSNLVPMRETQSTTIIASQLSTVPPSSSVPVNRVRSPYVIDLTQDSPPSRPRNYCDLTQFRTPSVLPYVSTISPQLWSSPLVKHESLSGHVACSLGPWQSPTVCRDQEVTLHRQLQHAPYPRGQLLMNHFPMQNSGASPFMGNPQSQQPYLCPSVPPSRHPSILIPHTAQSNIMTPLYQPSTVPPSFPVSHIQNPNSEQQRPQGPWNRHLLAGSHQPPRNPEQQLPMSNLHWNLASLQSLSNQSSHIPQSSSEN